jgi:hypothetical protein
LLWEKTSQKGKIEIGTRTQMIERDEDQGKRLKRYVVLLYPPVTC